MGELDTAREPSTVRYSGFRSLAIEVSEDDIRAAVLARANEMRATFKAPGFRPGKVPTQFIANRMGEQLREEAFHRLLQDRANEAIPESDKRSMLGRPVIREAKEASQDPAVYRRLVEYSLLPEIPPVAIEELEFDHVSAEIDDDEVRESLLEHFRINPIPGSPVEGRSAVAGDFVSLDCVVVVQRREFASTVDREPVHVRASLEAPEESPQRRVVGMSAGGTFSLDRVFPQDTGDARIRGARGTYRYTVRDVSPPLEPVLDEQFAAALGVPSVAEALQRHRASLVRAAQPAGRRLLHAQLYWHLCRIEAETDPDQERTLAARLREAELAPHPENHSGGDPETADVDRHLTEGITPEELVCARRILRYRVLLVILARRLGINIEPADAQRVLAGWTLDRDDPANAGAFSAALETLQKNPTIRAMAEHEAGAERLLDAILPRARSTESRMRLRDLDARNQEEGREWMIAQTIS